MSTLKRFERARRDQMAAYSGVCAPKLGLINTMLAEGFSPREIADHLIDLAFRPTDAYAMAQSIRHIRRRGNLQRLLGA